jgi:hypothetical protein
VASARRREHTPQAGPVEVHDPVLPTVSGLAGADLERRVVPTVHRSGWPA